MVHWRLRSKSPGKWQCLTPLQKAFEINKLQYWHKVGNPPNHLQVEMFGSIPNNNETTLVLHNTSTILWPKKCWDMLGLFGNKVSSLSKLFGSKDLATLHPTKRAPAWPSHWALLGHAGLGPESPWWVCTRNVCSPSKCLLCPKYWHVMLIGKVFKQTIDLKNLLRKCFSSQRISNRFFVHWMRLETLVPLLCHYAT